MATEIREGLELGAGRYELERLLGSGGMATVWLARDTRLQRRVAVKLLSDALAADSAFKERFAREARLAARIAHPNLVAIYDFGSEDRPYLVMEYIEGPSLAARLRGRPETIDPELVARALLEALACIHSSGVVHRDVKPANLLLGVDGRPRLTDFGIALHEGGSRLTMTGNVMGTLRYIAPEVKAGRPSTPRSDLFAAGVVIDETLADRPAPALRRLVKRLCDADPLRRPGSAEAALSELETTRPAATARERVAHLRPPPPENRRWVAPALLLIATCVLLAALSSGGSAPRRPLPAPAAPLHTQLDALDRAVRGLGR